MFGVYALLYFFINSLHCLVFGRCWLLVVVYFCNSFWVRVFDLLAGDGCVQEMAERGVSGRKRGRGGAGAAVMPRVPRARRGQRLRTLILVAERQMVGSSV